MNFGKLFSNPTVLIIGGGLGLLLLLSRGFGGGGSGDGGGGYALAALQVTDNTNRAMLAASASATAINADVTKARIAGDVNIELAALSAVTSITNQNTVRRQANDAVQAGVFNSLIATNAAVRIDQEQNFARMYAANVSRDITKIQTRGAVDIARVQADVAKHVSDNSIWTGAIDAFAKVAPAAIAAL